MLEKIEKKFVEGYLETTLEMLARATEDDYEYNLQIKSTLARWNSLEDNYNSGGLRFDDFEIQKAQIRREIIEVFKKIKKGEIQIKDAEKPNPKGKQKILFLAANPLDTTRLQLGEEFREIDEALRLGTYRDKFDLLSQWAVTPKTLLQTFLRENATIIHFSGHGEKQNEILVNGKTINLGGLVINDETNKDQMHVLDAAGIDALFKNFKNIQCVLLNACYSQEQTQIIKKYVPHIVGMSRAIPDATARAFSVGFYKALGEGKDVPFAFEMGKTFILLQKLAGADIPVLL